MIGAIADDFTGATDIAAAFRRAGLNVTIYFDGPGKTAPASAPDVIVIGLKTRTIDPDDAVRQSLDAAAWLRAHGARQIFFKYCSTFDSRPEGNIGPVTDALADALGAPRVVFAPASPEHRRTQYMGHLFVDKLLLSDSSMRHHPLTPMTNSYLPDVLQAQTSRTVGLVTLQTVRSGADRIVAKLDAETSAGVPYILVDAIDEDDLIQLGDAVVSEPLVTGAAGLANGVGAALARRLGRDMHAQRSTRDAGDVRSAVLAGSCSARTLQQISAMQDASHPSLRLDAVTTPDSDALATAALQWYDQQPTAPAPLIYSSLPPAQLQRVQQRLGVERASEVLETAMGLIAVGLVERGVQRLVVAGGETSGAVVQALAVDGGAIGHEAAPGVPWIHTNGDDPVALLLKSGNFGDPQLLVHASSGVLG